MDGEDLFSTSFNRSLPRRAIQLSRKLAGRSKLPVRPGFVDNPADAKAEVGRFRQDPTVARGWGFGIGHFANRCRRRAGPGLEGEPIMVRRCWRSIIAARPRPKSKLSSAQSPRFFLPTVTIGPWLVCRCGCNGHGTATAPEMVIDRIAEIAQHKGMGGRG